MTSPNFKPTVAFGHLYLAILGLDMVRWQDLLHAKLYSVLLAMPSAPSQTAYQFSLFFLFIFIFYFFRCLLALAILRDHQFPETVLLPDLQTT